MNKTLPYSKHLMGRAIAGKQHPISDPENTLWTVKKCSILLLVDTPELKKHALLSCKIPFIQWYQWLKQVKTKFKKPALGLFSQQISTICPPFVHHKMEGIRYE